jgi:hypothetical protein
MSSKYETTISVSSEISCLTAATEHATLVTTRKRIGVKYIKKKMQI